MVDEPTHHGIRATADRTIACLGCGYLLTGLRDHRCPECGQGFDPANPETTVSVRLSPTPLRTHVLRVAMTALVITAVTSIYGMQDESGYRLGNGTVGYTVKIRGFPMPWLGYRRVWTTGREGAFAARQWNMRTGWMFDAKSAAISLGAVLVASILIYAAMWRGQKTVIIARLYHHRRALGFILLASTAGGMAHEAHAMVSVFGGTTALLPLLVSAGCVFLVLQTRRSWTLILAGGPIAALATCWGLTAGRALIMGPVELDAFADCGDWLYGLVMLHAWYILPAMGWAYLRRW